MKYALVLLIAFFVTDVSAQNDVLPLLELPYLQEYGNAFENGQRVGWTQFNGGTLAQPGSTMVVGSGSGGLRGARLNGYTNIPGAKYRITMALSSTSGYSVYSQWPTSVFTTSSTTTALDTVVIHFTADGTAGGFGNNVVIANGGSTAGETVTVEFFQLSRLNDNRDIPSLDEVISTDYVDQRTNYLYYNDFESSTSDISFFQSSGSISQGELTVTRTTGIGIATFGATLFPTTCSFTAILDIEIGDTPVRILPVWQGGQDYSITTSGRYSIDFSRRNAQPNPSLDGLVMLLENPGTVKVKDVKIILHPDRYLKNFVDVEIGTNSFTSPRGDLGVNGPIENNRPGVTIGYNASGSHDGVTIGSDAKAGINDLFGAVQNGEEMVAVGSEAKAYGWRTTAVGSEASAGAQSSTAVGSGAEVYTTHGNVFGRGSMLYDYPSVETGLVSETGGTFDVEAVKMYLGNGWAHQFPSPNSDQSIGGEIPSTREASYFGMDAFDARHPIWSSGKSATKGHIYFRSGTDSVFIATQTTTESPTSGSTAWSFFKLDTGGTRSDFNIDGGHTGTYSGRATGSGTSGENRFYTAEGNNGPNLKDDPFLSMVLRSNPGNRTDGTDLFLYDRAEETMRRVKYHERHVNAGTAKIISTRSLYLE